MVIIAVVVMAMWALMNIMKIDKIGWINNFAAVY
jgi:hypothetical protein